MRPRTLLKAGVLAAAAAGFVFALSLDASADVVEPKSAYQPASVGLLDEEAAKAVVPDAAKPDPVGADADAAAEEAEASRGEVAEATPAPEQVVRQAPPLLTERHAPSRAADRSVADRVVHPLRMGFQHIGASLGRVVGACDVGFGPGSGGPVLVFAVIALAAPFIRRRVFATRRAADEDVPEFLFARELTPPG